MLSLWLSDLKESTQMSNCGNFIVNGLNGSTLRFNLTSNLLLINRWYGITCIYI